MTEKQIERVKLKIEKLKKALAADKKYWGGYYHDAQGIRYALPELYIKIEDYKNGLRYLNWFNKNFPGDTGHALFLFESAFILFKSKKVADAEAKIFSTYFSNIQLFDKFLEKELFKIPKDVDTSWERESVEKYFNYSRHTGEFEEFAIWIEILFARPRFLDMINEFFQIELILEKEPVGKRRSALIERRSQIESGYF